MLRTVLITGANRGLGWDATRVLLQRGCAVFLCGRSAEKCSQAADRLTQSVGREACAHLRIVELDVTDDRSVAAAAEVVRAMLVALRPAAPSLDVLVNNAAVFELQSADPARDTIAANYFGTLRVTHAFRSLLSPADARIINLSSELGLWKNISDFKLIDAFASGTLSEGAISQLAQDYVARRSTGVAVRGDPSPADALPPDPYYASKALIGAWTVAHATQRSWPGVTVNAMSPGWCRTDMGGAGAPRSIEQGSDTIVWLAVDKSVDGVTGRMFADRQQISFIDGRPTH